MHVTDRTKDCYPLRLGAAIIIAFFFCVFLMPDGSGAASSPKFRQKTFVSPEEGVTAMIDALKSRDDKALNAIFGPTGMQLISFGNETANHEVRQAFLTTYQDKNWLEKVGDSRAILHTGMQDWPFPIPIVNKGQAWYFDVTAGKDEVLNRQIGSNELSAIQVCLAYVDAQKEYALGYHGKEGFIEYAQKFVSDPGMKNGLYWEPREGGKLSPLGPAIARASKTGYKKVESLGAPLPYHGYYYKILKAQGKNAAGGAYEYVVNGKMIGGFALVAYPAEYGRSGIMTFIVSMDGIVYQKNLGKNSAKAAEAFKLFDPDKTWKMSVYGLAAK